MASWTPTRTWGRGREQQQRDRDQRQRDARQEAAAGYLADMSDGDGGDD
jgi:hypothetical protein